MRKTWRKLLSVLLALSMVASLTATGFAADFGSRNTPKGLEPDELKPSTINVPRLGELNEDEESEAGVELPYHFGDIVRVSIVLDGDATLERYSAQNVAQNAGAMAYRDGLKNQQAVVTANIEKTIGRKLDVKWNLTLAMNVISANVRYGDIAMIRSVPGVKRVVLENRYDVQADDPDTAVSTTDKMINATSLWAAGYTGAGSRVAIIDTGTNFNHLSFDGDALLYSLKKNAEDKGLTYDEYSKDLNLLSQDKVAAVAGQLNAAGGSVSSSQAYKNLKVPFGYNYVDGDYDVTHANDGQGEHGSHVSGIAAANRYVKQNGEYTEAVESVFAVGAAPDAQILAMKVFGKGGGAYDSDYMAAIEDAIVLGCDSANLSLGSAASGFVFSNEYQSVMNSLADNGMVVAFSAGNSDSWSHNVQQQKVGFPGLQLGDVRFHTGGSPGSFINSLTIASADNVGTVGAPLKFNGGAQTVFYTENVGEYGNTPIAGIAGDYEYVLVDGPGVDDNNHVGMDGDQFLAIGSNVLSGKVAICYRGSSSFFAKANAALAQGAAAVVIINNTDGTISMDLTGLKYQAPVVSILKADGDAVKAASEAVTDADGNVLYYTGSVTITDTMEVGITSDSTSVSSFSSWGVPGALILKPELTTPGGNIWSVNGMNDTDYEAMSGTSMAAPHAAGMAALMAQYVRENGLEEKTGETARTLINSLLMSTAIPMKDDSGEYVSLLQQGAGLGNVFSAASAKSYITMGEDATRSYADGKVKVELGEDAERTGSYTYSFTVNNFSDIDLEYDLDTEMFTQDLTGFLDEDNNPVYLLADNTTPIEADVTYDWEHETIGPDVNMDGQVNKDDAQAIVDKLTGEYPEDAKFDETAADLDGDGTYTSYDAHLLLLWLEEDHDGLVVPANDSVTVTVTIELAAEDKAALDEYFVNGAYIEGFTTITCVTESEDGAIADVEHSIPILGYYGNWTDPSMFDHNTLIDALYTGYSSYFDNDGKGGMVTKQNNKTYLYTGNPYTVEDEFPEERLAINSNTEIVSFRNTLIRNAANAQWLMTDASNSVLASGKLQSDVYAAFYHTNEGKWYYNEVSTTNVKKTPASVGLKEDDVFTAGYYAIPEYYGLELSDGTDGNVDESQFLSIVTDGTAGAGSMMGYTMTVDDTAPEILETTEERDDDGNLTSVTVKVKDNRYVAYLAITDLSGRTVFDGVVPEQSAPGEEIEYKFDLSALGDLPNAVALFVGDYAANETAKLVRINDGNVFLDKECYRPVEAPADGESYLIVNTDQEGNGFAVQCGGAGAAVIAAPVTLHKDDAGVYIDAADVDDTFQWLTTEAAEGIFVFENTDAGAYLGYQDLYAPYFSWSNANWADPFKYEDHLLKIADSFGLAFSEADGWTLDAPTEVYFFGPSTYQAEIDPESALEVNVLPESEDLILGAKETVQLSAEVLPTFLEDRTVTWSSSDERVATVDETGLVTAVSAGTATITATSNKTPSVSGSAVINVLEPSPINAVINAQVTNEEGETMSAIDLSNMNVTALDPECVTLAGGGRHGNILVGNDASNEVYKLTIRDDGLFDIEDLFTIIPNYVLLDAANIPSWQQTFTTEATDEAAAETVTETYEFSIIGFGPTYFQLFTPGIDDLAYFNLSGLAKFVALTFAGAFEDDDGVTNLVYYALADNGDLYALFVYGEMEDGEADLSLSYIKLGTLTGALEMGEDPTAYSMSYLYYQTGEDMILIADNTTGYLYSAVIPEKIGGEIESVFVGAVPECTNLSTLFNDDFDAIDSLIEDSADDGNGFGARLASRLDAARANASMQATTVSRDVFAVSGSRASFGGLNAVANRPTATGEGDPATEPAEEESAETVTVEISEDVNVTNGLYEVTYDPAELTYVGDESAELDTYSIHVDEENGTIAVAFANVDAVEAGDVITTLTFEAPCEDETVTVKTQERSDELDLDEEEEITLKGVGHEWSEPEWNWSDDNSSATASFTCENNDSHEQELAATVTTETTKPTQTKDGKIVYTATVTGPDGEVYTDTREEVLPATGLPVLPPDYNTPTTPSNPSDGSGHKTPFIDVPDDAPYVDAVIWAVDNGITTGTSATTFSPELTVTRAMAVTFLWRAMGQPKAVNSVNPFTDVKTTDYFYDAVLWAVEKGITIGTSATTFSPELTCTNAHMLTFLYRTLGCPNATGAEPWYADAMNWAINAKVAPAATNPNADCPRRDVVQFLYLALK